MSIEQVQNTAINDAMKALADYRTAAGIQPAKRQPAESNQLQVSTSSQITDEITIAQPRIGRYVNIFA